MKKATGIVRRIDDLGRIVIPKEIRRTLRIAEGDPMEIYVDCEGEVILKKYSPVRELREYAQEYAQAIHEATCHIVLITDTDKVVTVAGGSKKDFLLRDVGPKVTQAMDTFDTVNTVQHEYIILGYEKEGPLFAVISPIIVENKAIGSVVICSATNPQGPSELAVAKTASTFLAKQMSL